MPRISDIEPVEPASALETREAIVRRSGRDAFPLRVSFLQQKHDGGIAHGPMSKLVESRNKSALLLYGLALTQASSEPWDVALSAAVWARALGFPHPTSTTSRARISKTWTRLVKLNLVSRSRRANTAEFTLLREDGSGKKYTHPGVEKTERYLQMPHALWLEGPEEGKYWFKTLQLPALVFLFIARSHKPGETFALPAERAPDYYGISADTIQRGVRQLRKLNLIEVTQRTIKAPLAPEGVTRENRYLLLPPFDREGNTKNDN